MNIKFVSGNLVPELHPGLDGPVLVSTAEGPALCESHCLDCLRPRIHPPFRRHHSQPHVSSVGHHCRFRLGCWRWERFNFSHLPNKQLILLQMKLPPSCGWAASTAERTCCWPATAGVGATIATSLCRAIQLLPAKSAPASGWETTKATSMAICKCLLTL